MRVLKQIVACRLFAESPKCGFISSIARSSKKKSDDCITFWMVTSIQQAVQNNSIYGCNVLHVIENAWWPMPSCSLHCVSVTQLVCSVYPIFRCILVHESVWFSCCCIHSTVTLHVWKQNNCMIFGRGIRDWSLLVVKTKHRRPYFSITTRLKWNIANISSHSSNNCKFFLLKRCPPRTTFVK